MSAFGTPSLGLGAVDPGANVTGLTVSRTRRGRPQHAGAGDSTITTIVRFVAWACEQQHFPTAEQVKTRFNCSNATAHRWLNALAAGYNFERPRETAGRVRKKVA